MFFQHLGIETILVILNEALIVRNSFAGTYSEHNRCIVTWIFKKASIKSAM